MNIIVETTTGFLVAAMSDREVFYNLDKIGTMMNGMSAWSAEVLKLEVSR